jgi:hypothetical protein
MVYCVYDFLASLIMQRLLVAAEHPAVVVPVVQVHPTVVAVAAGCF